MQAAAEQIQWILLEEILPCEDDRVDEDPNGAVQVNRTADGRYRLVGGSGTLSRLRESGQLCVDAAVRPYDRIEARVSALLDNLVRGDLHYLDEAESYRRLLAESHWTAQRLAEHIGRTPATLSRKMRLLELGAEVGEILRQSGLCERYAQALLRVPGREGRLRILRHVVEEGLSVKETEKLIDEVLSRMPVPITGGRRMKPLMRDYRLYVNAIRGIVEQMNDAGLDAHMQVTIANYSIELRISQGFALHPQGLRP